MKIYSWQDIESLNDKLTQKINDRPDIIVGILRGSAIPARLLSKSLNVKTMFALTIMKNNGERTVKTEILDNLEGKKILLVEDVLETGRSLIVGKEYLESKGAIVKTASYFIMPQSEIVADFYLEKVEERPKFPWE